ncbi:hypothetical protein CDL15_Pgr001797 [Punica granatum]|uniref:TF-B3 domain-containing protein n=1 Tax=Punica granatum TaxID=22663 RepID=A0A218XBA4_PUNGR|nr:hypothetical protein CDL15_Pgr001797 [Punica granatum]PKI76373.1 hypothetical protein CRG98_003295 [Punica granatum]
MEETGGSHFESPTPHFFKIIHPYSLRLGKISIPKRFVRKYGDNLPNAVILKVPNGESWKVWLEKCDDAFWLQKGWPEFIEHYSIEEQYLVNFCYVKKSVFQVVIFDKSATEIEYPLKSANVKRVKPVPESLSSEMEESAYKTSPGTLSGYEVEQEIECGHVEPDVESSSSEMEESTDNSVSIMRDLEPAMEISCDSDDLTPNSGKAINVAPPVSLTRRILKFAKSSEAVNFRSEYPFFHVLMTESYVKSGSVAISKGFIVRNNLEEAPQKVMLRHSDRLWPVSMNYYKAKARGGSLCGGWAAFVRQNHIKVGDICIFELVKKKGVIFNVTVLRCGG